VTQNRTEEEKNSKRDLAERKTKKPEEHLAPVRSMVMRREGYSSSHHHHHLVYIVKRRVWI
jgi:hypothetical protein